MLTKTWSNYSTQGCVFLLVATVIKARYMAIFTRVQQDHINRKFATTSKLMSSELMLLILI